MRAFFRHANREMTALIPWEGGFAAVEKKGDRPVRVWRSADGNVWRSARLPREIRSLRSLLPFRGGLILTGNADGSFTDQSFSLWRSPDGVRWHASGSIRLKVPARYPDHCQLNHVYEQSAAGRLIVLAAMCRDACCGLVPLPDGPQLALAGSAARAAAASEPGGEVVWTSRGGVRWTRHDPRGVADGSGDELVDIIGRASDGLLAFRRGREQTVLRSRNGVAWEQVAVLPDRYDADGQQAIAEVTDGFVLVGDGPDGRGYGNNMVAWVSEPDGTWTQVLDLQPAYVHSMVADGDTVIASGESWAPGPEGLDGEDIRWAWTLVSLDGGRTWDPASSWTGAVDSCLWGIAVHDGTAVMIGCVPGDPPMYATALPGR